MAAARPTHTLPCLDSLHDRPCMPGGPGTAAACGQGRHTPRIAPVRPESSALRQPRKGLTRCNGCQSARVSAARSSRLGKRARVLGPRAAHARGHERCQGPRPLAAGRGPCRLGRVERGSKAGSAVTGISHVEFGATPKGAPTTEVSRGSLLVCSAQRWCTYGSAHAGGSGGGGCEYPRPCGSRGVARLLEAAMWGVSGAALLRATRGWGWRMAPRRCIVPRFHVGCEGASP